MKPSKPRVPAISPPPRIACEPGLVSNHDRPEPAPKSTATELPRIVDLVNEHHRPEPALTVAQLPRTELPRIDGRTEPTAPEPTRSVDELAVDAEVRGVKLRGGARGAGIRALERVLIVLIVVAGAVAIVRSLVTSPDARRPDVGRCIERPNIEGIERKLCAHDGS